MYGEYVLFMVRAKDRFTFSPSVDGSSVSGGGPFLVVVVFMVVAEPSCIMKKGKRERFGVYLVVCFISRPRTCMCYCVVDGLMAERRKMENESTLLDGSLLVSVVVLSILSKLGTRELFSASSSASLRGSAWVSMDMIVA